MRLKKLKEEFEKNKKIYDSKKLKFIGVDGFDVYNPSIPFEFQNKTYIFGRLEKREEWARSWVRLFEKTGDDTYSLVQNSMIYQLEDPYISKIGDEIVMGGTHVRYSKGEIDTYYGYFYRGLDINNMYYFTTGPDYMKDIRLIELDNGEIGVFSRPRSKEIYKKYGSESVVGFTTVKSLDELCADKIENAKVIEELIHNDEWGGCNQCYRLKSGKIGVIGHQSYNDNGVSVYMNTAFVFDPIIFEVSDFKIIGTRRCYPEGPSKKPDLVDCAFTSGICKRNDEKVNLYSGIGDCEAGRITIDNPFAKDEIIW